MKTLFAALSLLAALSVGTMHQTAAAATPQASQKVIKDPAEYNAYMQALNLKNPAKKAAAMEAFLQAYPNSIVVADALEQAMAAYQAAGDAKHVERTAQRLLTLRPENIRALAILTALERVAATNGDATALAEMREHAEHGSRNLKAWSKPDGTSAAEFGKLRAQMAAIFSGATGFALLNDKNYAGARDSLLTAVAAEPADMQNIYQLGIAEVQMTPLDVNGFWHLARAMNLAAAQKNTTAHDGIAKFAKAKYKHYHGGDDGWDAIVKAAGVKGAMPKTFAASIKPAPTAAEIAVKEVNENDPAQLSFSDWEYVLSYRDASPANTAAAAKVWAAIQAMEKNGATKLKMDVTVVSATSDAIEASISDDNIQAKTADLHIALAQPAPAPPAAGTVISVTGVITSYEPQPFKFTMTQGAVLPRK